MYRLLYPFFFQNVLFLIQFVVRIYYFKLKTDYAQFMSTILLAFSPCEEDVKQVTN